MRILFLSVWCPIPADNGAKLRISHLLRGLARVHEIDLLTFAPELADDAARDELQRVCTSLELIHETPFPNRKVGRLKGLLSSRPRSVVANYSAAMDAAVRRRIQEKQHYDVVIASDIHMAPYALLIGNTPRVLEGLELATIFDQYITQTRLLQRLRYGMTWKKTARYAASLLTQFAGTTVVSDREWALIRQIAPDDARLVVVPNGVDVAGNAGNFGTPEPNTLIYPGALSYDANFDAVAYFASEVLPRIRAVRPAVRLCVTGKATPAQIAALPTTEGIEFTGYVTDVRPTIARAWAEVVPLRKGSGTRLKILEALALGTPVITTSKGVEGLNLQPERDILLADSPAALAEQTLRLLDAPALRQTLVANGRRAVEPYDWHHSATRLNDLINAITTDTQPQRGAVQLSGRKI